VIGTSFGPYRIESLLGRGGMGEVYRAVDTGQDGRRVALKVLTPALSDDPQFAARFRREAEIAARLSEPHVVPIHRYGEIDGRLFLDMQLVDGRELADVIAHDGPLSPDRALAILEQVGGALDAAHTDGLVHRDVKPSNILLTRPGAARPEFAYLLDFGIARATEPDSRTALTRTGAMIGTLSYMAPEQFRALPPGPASDIYSLACVLHEMLTGALPYPGTGYAAQVTGHLHQPPPRPSTVRPGLPAALDAVVAQGMAKDPAARYPRAGDLVVAARSALSSNGVAESPAATVVHPAGAALTITGTPEPAAQALPVTPPPPPLWTPGVPAPTRRRRWWLPVLGAAGLAIAVLATVLIVARPAPDGEVAAAPPSAVVPVDALPTGGPITERAIVGRAVGNDPLTVAELEGTPVLVMTATNVETVVFDMATGELIGEPLEGSLAGNAATVTRIDGRSILITGGADRVIRLWDLATGEPLATTLTGHTGALSQLEVVDVDGGKVLVSGSYDGTVRRWDLATAAPIGEPLTGITDGVTSLSVARDGDRSVVLAKAHEGPIHSWDIESGAPFGPPIPTVYDHITTTALPGGLAVLSHPVDYRLQVTDLRSGAPLDAPAHSARGFTYRAVAVVAGRLLLVGAEQEDIRIRDLRTGDPVGSPLTGHEDAISSLTPVAVGDTTYLVSTSRDRSIRIWDLTARAGG
jgi:hypothetical protein